MRLSVVVIYDAIEGLTHHQQIPTKSCNKLIVVPILVRLAAINFFFSFLHEFAHQKFRKKMKMEHVTQLIRYFTECVGMIRMHVVIPDCVEIH